MPKLDNEKSSSKQQAEVICETIYQIYKLLKDAQDISRSMENNYLINAEVKVDKALLLAKNIDRDLSDEEMIVQKLAWKSIFYIYEQKALQSNNQQHDQTFIDYFRFYLEEYKRDNPKPLEKERYKFNSMMLMVLKQKGQQRTEHINKELLAINGHFGYIKKFLEQYTVDQWPLNKQDFQTTHADLIYYIDKYTKFTNVLSLEEIINRKEAIKLVETFIDVMKNKGISPIQYGYPAYEYRSLIGFDSKSSDDVKPQPRKLSAGSLSMGS